MGVEGITGLKINYWAMVNLEGFKDLVDAVGWKTFFWFTIAMGIPAITINGGATSA